MNALKGRTPSPEIRLWAGLLLASEGGTLVEFARENGMSVVMAVGWIRRYPLLSNHFRDRIESCKGNWRAVQQRVESLAAKARVQQ